MNCPNPQCKTTDIPEDAKFCPNCGRSFETKRDKDEVPRNYMIMAILTTIFFFWPLGLVAIYKANSVGKLWKQDKYEEAQKASDSARNYSMYSIIIGVLMFLIMVAVNS